jgi:hypothetical protein
MFGFRPSEFGLLSDFANSDFGFKFKVCGEGTGEEFEDENENEGRGREGGVKQALK